LRAHRGRRTATRLNHFFIQTAYPTTRRRTMRMLISALCLATLAPLALAQTPACPEKSVQYWQAFPPGGESDLSARHQQIVLKKKCPAIDTVVQYKPGAGGGLM
jgi:tripartite-type tricarboxylate transporter receptor subunit TctC